MEKNIIKQKANEWYIGLPQTPNYKYEFTREEIIDLLTDFSSQLEPLVMPNEVVAGGNNELLKFLRWLYDQEELELTETGWYYKEDEEGTYELSNLEVLNKYYASQRKA